MNYPEILPEIFEEASERGIAHASWLLSVLYKTGIAVEQSDSRSLEYLKTGVAQGSLCAQRDLAILAAGGFLPQFSQRQAYTKMAELVAQGVDRASLGEKLLFCGNALLARQGYEALRLQSLQNRGFRPRFLVSLYETLQGNMPCSDKMTTTMCLYVRNQSESAAAERTLSLAALLELGITGESKTDVAVNLISIDSVEAAIDAMDILQSEEFGTQHHELKERAFKKLQSYAHKGVIQAKVYQTAYLLAHAHPDDNAGLAIQLVGLLKENPEYMRQDYDSLIHAAKESDPSIAPLHLDLAHELVKSGVCPVSFRSLGIELMIAERPAEALEYLQRAVDLEVPAALKNIVCWYGQYYSKTNDSFEDTLFWHQALMLENSKTGCDYTSALLDLKMNRDGKLSDSEIMLRKSCLEVNSANGDAESTRELALLLINGAGPVLQDPKAGIELLEKAAATDGRAMYELAHVYQAGVLVPRDLYLSQHYFDEAAKHGHSNAIYEENIELRRASAEEANELNPDCSPENVVNLCPETDGRDST